MEVNLTPMQMSFLSDALSAYIVENRRDPADDYRTALELFRVIVLAKTIKIEVESAPNIRII